MNLIALLTPIGVYLSNTKEYKVSSGKKVYNRFTKEREYVPAVWDTYEPQMYLKIPKDCPADERINYSNKKVPQQYTLCTYIRKGKDYPYNSTKRGWEKVD